MSLGVYPRALTVAAAAAADPCVLASLPPWWVNAGAVAVRVGEGVVPVVLVAVLAVLWALVVELRELVVLDSSGARATETVLVEDPPQPPIRARHAPTASTLARVRIGLAVAR